MNYRNLQRALKSSKKKGHTKVKLNACHALLQEEYNRLIQSGLIIPEALKSHSVADQVFGNGCIRLHNTHNVGPETEISHLVSRQEKSLFVDPVFQAAEAESWTKDPVRKIATAVAYSVADFEMLALWIALIATTLVISALKCWHWCRNQYSDLALQFKHFDPSFEFPTLAKPQLTSFIPMRLLFVH